MIRLGMSLTAPQRREKRHAMPLPDMERFIRPSASSLPAHRNAHRECSTNGGLAHEPSGLGRCGLRKTGVGTACTSPAKRLQCAMMAAEVWPPSTSKLWMLFSGLGLNVRCFRLHDARQKRSSKSRSLRRNRYSWALRVIDENVAFRALA